MLSQLTSKLNFRLQGQKLEDMPAVIAATAQQAVQEAIHEALEGGFPAMEETTLLRTVGWVTAGLGAVALGLVVGRELRQRYKFNRRTPYDFYAHSGEDGQDLEFGVGI
jgi:hypothetical protein